MFARSECPHASRGSRTDVAAAYCIDAVANAITGSTPVGGLSSIPGPAVCGPISDEPPAGPKGGLSGAERGRAGSAHVRCAMPASAVT